LGLTGRAMISMLVTYRACAVALGNSLNLQSHSGKAAGVVLAIACK